MFREFCQALDIDGHKQLHGSVIQITGSPNAGKSKTAEMICHILEVRRAPTTSKKFWKLILGCGKHQLGELLAFLFISCWKDARDGQVQ